MQRWTRADDKRTLRLPYLQASLHYRLIGYIGDELEVYGSIYMLPPISLGHQRLEINQRGLSRVGRGKDFLMGVEETKPTSLSRSTTEGEVVSLAHTLFAEAIPALQLSTVLAGRNMRLEIEEDNQATILVGKRGSAETYRARAAYSSLVVARKFCRMRLQYLQASLHYRLIG